jgi:putative DNA primase/helicase
VGKRIEAHGAKFHKGALVIPLWADGELCSLQFIQPNGDKKFLTGGRVKGCCFLIGTVRGARTLCIAEGFATAASIHEATGHPVAVAFNAGNLLEVAKRARRKFPDLPLILCADDDFRTPGNPGLTMATAAAKVVGAKLAVPDFGRDRPEGATDFNDMLVARGAEEVARAVESAKAGRPMSCEQPDTHGPDTAEVSRPPACLDDAAPPKARAKARVNGATKVEAESDVDYMAALPEPDAAMFHGLIGEVARTASAGTEVNPVAAAATSMAFLSASVGRFPHIMVGNRRHPLLIWPLHNGRTSVGGKGMAHDLTDLIRGRLRENIAIDAPFPVGAPKLQGRLSTGEGLAHAIRDPREPTHENDPGDPGEPDKRVYAVETEFAGVLYMTRREGCSLSPVLRDAFDGNPIGSQTKTAKSTCEKPHVVVVGAITPRELLAEVTDKEVANGLINRFLIFFAERIDVVPFPPSTLPEQVQRLARHAGEVIRWAWAKERNIRLNDEARALYESYYREFNRSQRRSGDSESVKLLCERHPPYVLRIAALYAVADAKEVINADHMRAALAWVRYSAESIRLLFNAERAAKSAMKQAKLTEKILALFDDRKELTRTEISDGLGRNFGADEIDSAIRSLLMNRQLVMEERERERGHGSRVKHYKKPLTNSTNCTNSGSQQGIAAVRGDTNSGTNCTNPKQADRHPSVQFVTNSSSDECLPSPASRLSSSDSCNSCRPSREIF